MRIKSVLLYITMLVVTILFIEGIGRIVYFAYYKHHYTPTSTAQGLTVNTDAVYREVEDALRPGLRRQIFHPYLGTTYPSQAFEWNRPKAGDDSRYTVALFGGSVAFNARSKFQARIKQQFTRFGANEPYIAVYAHPAYKQPQQLVALAYASSIGKRLDLIINLDGYNEAVLALKENHARGVNPFFPMQWDLHLSRKKEIQEIRFETEKLRRQSVVFERWLENSILRYSALIGFIGRVLSDHTQGQIHSLIEKAVDTTPSGLEQTGPLRKTTTEDTIVDNWFRSSVMMATLADQLGAEYYHFLQPNQYFDGSKVLTEEEKKKAIKKHSKDSVYINTVYPKMRAYAHRLALNKVKFFDLTQIFSNTKETVYKDVCCHLNDLGESIMVDWIVKTVIDDLSGTKTLDSMSLDIKK